MSRTEISDRDHEFEEEKTAKTRNQFRGSRPETLQKQGPSGERMFSGEESLIGIPGGYKNADHPRPRVFSIDSFSTDENDVAPVAAGSLGVCRFGRGQLL